MVVLHSTRLGIRSTMAEAVFLTFFPATIAGLGCAVAWRLVPKGPRRTALQVVGSLLFFVPQLAVMIFGGSSIHLVLHREAILALWFLGIAAVAAWHIARVLTGNAVPNRRYKSQQIHRSPVIMGVVGVAFGIFGVSLGSAFIRDVLLPRVAIEGHVSKKWIYYGRSGAHWYVSVDGRTFEVTRDVYTQLRQNDVIRAQVGAGSHAFLGVERR